MSPLNHILTLSISLTFKALLNLYLQKPPILSYVCVIWVGFQVVTLFPLNALLAFPPCSVELCDALPLAVVSKLLPELLCNSTPPNII